MKKVPVVRVVRPDIAAILPGLPAEASVALASIAQTMREGLLAFTTAAGLAVFAAMLDAELTGLIGPKHAKNPARTGNWHGTTAGPVVLGGRKVTVERPRGRRVDGTEIALATWAVAAGEDLLTQVVVERMLAGVATRRHSAVAEPMGDALVGRSTSKSAVSRRFVAATEKAVAELLARDLSGLDVAVLMIDGVHFAGEANQRVKPSSGRCYSSRHVGPFRALSRWRTGAPARQMGVGCRGPLFLGREVVQVGIRLSCL